MLRRYCADYDPRYGRVDSFRVPRFLLNDLVRYWRTIAVDFAAKKWRSPSQKAYIRFAKLLTTRKVLFAGSLAALLLTEKHVRDVKDPDERFNILQQHLQSEFSRPPIARLLGAYDALGDEAKDATVNLLVQYDAFLGLLNERSMRTFLEREPDESVAGRRSGEARARGPAPVSRTVRVRRS